MTDHQVDTERMKTDSRYAAWVRQRFGARRTVDRVLDDEEFEIVVKAKAAVPRLPAPYLPALGDRAGRRTAAAIAAIQRLRTDIAAGLPHGALLERIDDELYRLANRKP